MGLLTGFKRERCPSLDSELDEGGLAVAETLFRLCNPSGDSSAGSKGVDESQEEQSSSISTSSSGTRVATTPKQFQAATTCGTRSYVWRGPSRRLGPKVNVCPSQVLSSDPDDEEEAGGAAAAAGAGDPSRVDRDKEWAALTTWLRMNLHHPRTAKREVLFLGRHVDGRGWQFFLNPALSWADVSPETKLRLRTLPQETELAFMHKYPSKAARDWVKKSQKYRPPGSAVTFSVPLADMVYSLTAIYYQHEGRPGVLGGQSAVRAKVAAASAAAAAASAAAAAGGVATGVTTPTVAVM